MAIAVNLVEERPRERRRFENALTDWLKDVGVIVNLKKFLGVMLPNWKSTDCHGLL
jgi:hypothetical protein